MTVVGLFLVAAGGGLAGFWLGQAIGRDAYAWRLLQDAGLRRHVIEELAAVHGARVEFRE